jgi:hypothetical protein
MQDKLNDGTTGLANKAIPGPWWNLAVFMRTVAM